jgi:hypothetical protein
VTSQRIPCSAIGACTDSPALKPTPAGMRLIDHRPHHRIPYDIDNTDHEEHHSYDGRVQPVHIIIIKEQPDADRLVDQVLCQIARTETDALSP